MPARWPIPSPGLKFDGDVSPFAKFFGRQPLVSRLTISNPAPARRRAAAVLQEPRRNRSRPAAERLAPAHGFGPGGPPPRLTSARIRERGRPSAGRFFRGGGFQPRELPTIRVPPLEQDRARPYALADDKVRLYYKEVGQGTPVFIRASNSAATTAAGRRSCANSASATAAIAYAARGYTPSDGAAPIRTSIPTNT